jgi:hypothetical protein
MSDQQAAGNRAGTAGDDAIRASDSERAVTVDRLKTAHDEGRLTLDEFTDRIAKTRQAQTRGELQALVADLPAPSATPSGSRAGGQAASGQSPETRILPIGGWKQRGRIRLDHDIDVFSLIGGVDLDLTDAEFAADEVTVTSISLLGGADVTAPANVRVEVEGMSLLGGREIKTRQPSDPAAPVLRLRIWRLIGGVEVQNS